MLEIWLVVTLLALAVLLFMGHAWVLGVGTLLAAVVLAVASGIQMRRFGLDGVFPFSHHDRHRQM